MPESPTPTPGDYLVATRDTVALDLFHRLSCGPIRKGQLVHLLATPEPRTFDDGYAIAMVDPGKAVLVYVESFEPLTPGVPAKPFDLADVDVSLLLWDFYHAYEAYDACRITDDDDCLKKRAELHLAAERVKEHRWTNSPTLALREAVYALRATSHHLHNLHISADYTPRPSFRATLDRAMSQHRDVMAMSLATLRTLVERKLVAIGRNSDQRAAE
jgi:hypothetical protein